MEKHVEKRNFPVRAVFNALLIFLIITAVGITAAFYADRPTSSDIEKRELVKLPEFSMSLLANGQYTRQLSAYFADTFPGREQLVRLASIIKENRGFQFGNIRIYSAPTDDSVINTQLPMLPAEVATIPQVSLPPVSMEGVPDPDTETLPGKTEQAPTVPLPEPTLPYSEPMPVVPPVESTTIDSVEEGVRMGAIFIYKNSGYTIFGGSDQMGQWYAQVLNAYQQVLGSQMTIYNLVLPTAIEFYLPSNYKSITTAQKPKLDGIAAALDPTIKWIDVYDTLSAHKDEYIYYRTDHHWSTLGAYYAYEQFAKTAGFEPLPISQMEKRTLNNFLGTLYSQTQNSRMAANPDYVDYFIMPTAYRCYQFRKGFPDTAVRVSLYGEYAKSYNSYSVFMHGDFPLTVIDTEIKNGRRIAVVKESYGNAFIPFLVNHYETVVVIDQRYLEKGFYDVLKEHQINELLFINNIAAAHTAVRIQELASLPTRTYIPPQEILDSVAVDTPQNVASVQ